MALGGTIPLMMKAAAAAPAGDVPTKSLRFNDGDTPSLSRTLSVAGNRKTFTFSCWFKLSKVVGSSSVYMFSAGTSGERFGIMIRNDVLRVDGNGGIYLTSANKIRDLSGWMHICVEIDTTQSTSTERIKLYINGAEATYNTYSPPVQDSSLKANDTVLHLVGEDSETGGNNFDGYLFDVYFIDGIALDATSFAEEDGTTGQWVPKAYSGSYGDEGFHLDFEEDTPTSDSNEGIGKDVSGNENYFDTTSLAPTDIMLDNPSAGSNFCTLNPLDISRGTLSEGSLKYTATTSYWGTVRSTFAASTGKWYWEVTATTVSELQAWVAGILEVNKPLTNDYWYSTGWTCYGVMDDNLKVTGSETIFFPSGVTTGSVIGFRLDLDSSTIAISVDGDDKGTMFSSLTAAEYSPALNLYGDSGAVSVADVNFGQGDPTSTANNNFQDENGKGNFKYEPDSGYLAWCTNTLTATIAKGVTYFDTKIYDDGAGAKTFDNGTVSMQPDLVWVKSRGSAYDHKLTDSVRGVEEALESNTTDTEVTDSDGLTVFGSDGFTVGLGSAYSDQTGDGMVAWAWKADFDGSGGSGTDWVERYNATSGISIVSWTGDSSEDSTQEISHSLGVAPEFIIAKNRTDEAGGTGSWIVYHKDADSGEILILNDTAGSYAPDSPLIENVDNNSVDFGNDSMSSTSAEYLNGATMDEPAVGETYVAYLFASVNSYSKIGSFSGSSTAFIYTGFRPAFILAKRSDWTGGNWLMFDDKREGYNVDNDDLFANENYDENTTDHIDILSNGFKIRTSDVDLNAGTVIYYAVAKNPFKYASAR